jgi:NTP pyrophosphatase (non-canonical NTP hydrolase)
MERFLKVISTYKSVLDYIKQQPSLSDATYNMESLETFVKVMFEKHCPFKVGDRAKLSKTPDINEKDSWGWMGAKHFLIKGKEGTIESVDFHIDKFIFGFIPDNQTYIPSSGDRTEIPINEPYVYMFSEGWLEPIKYCKETNFCEEIDEACKKLTNHKIKQFDTLNKIADAVHELAWKKGWHSDSETEDAFIERACNNLHNEVSELHEAWRNNELHEPCDKRNDMELAGISPLTFIEEEFADIIIRVLDNCRKLKVDIQSAVERKHAYNATRAQRHGGKRS